MPKALAKEVAAYWIDVNVVAPGMTDTPFIDAIKRDSPEKYDRIRKRISMGRLGTPGDMAMAVLSLASEDAAYMAGQVLSPNGGDVI